MGKVKNFVKKYDVEISLVLLGVSSAALGSIVTGKYLRNKCAHTYARLTPAEHEHIAAIHIMSSKHKREFKNLVDGFTKTA